MSKLERQEKYPEGWGSVLSGFFDPNIFSQLRPPKVKTYEWPEFDNHGSELRKALATGKVRISNAVNHGESSITL